MAKIIGLPKLSPTMEEGTLSRWAVKEGDEVDVDDLLAEVETDKAVMEFRSFDRGVVLALLVAEGDVLVLESPVLIIGKAGEDVASLREEAKKAIAAAAPAGVGQTSVDRPAPVEASPPAPAAPAPAAPAPAARAPGERILSSPLVRRLAREHDLDLATIPGSGPRGRIIKRDVEAALSAPRPGAPVAAGVRLPPRVEKLSRMRAVIARRLTESKQSIPHFYLTVDVDAEPLARARKELNASLDGEKVSFNDIVVKAAAVALRRVPDANASFMGDSIHYHQVVDVSVAVAIPDGLVTPVVRDADHKGVLAISREMRDLAARARDRKLMPEEMTGGTFSVSNLGMYGIEEFAAVINPPEGAILAVGALREAPVVRDGQLVAGRRMKLTLSCDHRVVDGAVGARYLQALTGLLESPLRMLL